MMYSETSYVPLVCHRVLYVDIFTNGNGMAGDNFDMDRKVKTKEGSDMRLSLFVSYSHVGTKVLGVRCRLFLSF